MLQDLRHSLRAIRQAPGFSLVVTITVMLGVGATTAIFSVVDAVLLRPLPYPAQGSLVKLFDVQADSREVGALSGPEVADWRERALDVFDAVGAFGARGEVLSGAGDAEQLLGAQATAELPSLLGIQPLAGRIFRPDDERPGSRVDPGLTTVDQDQFRLLQQAQRLEFSPMPVPTLPPKQ